MGWCTRRMSVYYQLEIVHSNIKTLYTERRCSARHEGRYAHGGECAGGGLLYVGRCMLEMKVVVRIAREGQVAVWSVVRGDMVCVCGIGQVAGRRCIS
jgi:hypothetical protein